MRRYFLFTILAVLWIAGAAPASPSLHTDTNWDIRPSLKFDALCLLNALSNDPFYLTYYQADFDHFNPLFTPQERSAFQDLKKIIKDEGGGIISANLSLYFSVIDDETLDQMIQTARDSAKMRAALMQTSYWDADAWARYERARPTLIAALTALQRVGFPAYWETKVRPSIEKRIKELAPALPKYNIVPAIENVLGKPLPSNRITVYLLNYSEPHGIRITGTRFLTHVSYTFSIVLHNAIHEMMHPPYDLKDPAIRHAVDQLAAEPMLRDKIEHHDKSFGYNDGPGYVEEDCVQALEEVISEQFGAGHDARAYWKAQDGGMHILAAAIYMQYSEAVKKNPAPSFPTWLVQAVNAGNLQGQQLAVTLQHFFADSAPAPK